MSRPLERAGLVDAALALTVTIANLIAGDPGPGLVILVGVLSGLSGLAVDLRRAPRTRS